MSRILDAPIGQLIIVGFRGTELPDDAPILDAIRRGMVGGVWLCDYGGLTGEGHGNIASPEQLQALIAQVQSAASVPLLVSMDAEGGQVRRLAPEYGFSPIPSAGALGAANDLAATRYEADALAATLKRLGVNFNLAPVVDLNRNPENPALGRRERCFSADPHVVLAHARAFIQAHHAAGIACSLKHFPGHGSAAGDTHEGLVDVTRTWSVDELLPYMGLLGEGLADSVLTSHVVCGRIDETLPTSLSQAATTGLLREQMGFDGVIVTDDLGMGAIRRNHEFDDAIRLALKAGADVPLHANTGYHEPDIAQHIFEVIRKAVEKKYITPERIAQSHERIQRLKARLFASR